ncbi:MAG: hypothetical protein QOI98_3301, partial [Solirubrobacteraceae bacterium]|nr:hypothetical protein [Solirubrobacteraceae bacterium]
VVQGNTLRNFTSAAINISGSPTPAAASGSIIGGIAAGAGNVITASGTGVVITQPQTVSVEITSNSIFGNTRAIELTPATPTPNDPAPDADTGQNDLQNYPNITFAERTAIGATIRGTLISAPSTPYLVQIFATPAPDAEAKTLLGSLNITTDATGSATFELSTTGASPAIGDLITATATNRALAAAPGSSPNSTSEVGPAVAVAVSIPVEGPFVLALLAAAIAAAGVFAARR